MGRIADALKRAEEERRRSTEDVIQKPSGATTTMLPLEPGKSPELSAVDNDLANDEDEQPVKLIDSMSEALVPYYEPSSLISEQYRGLRTRLLSSNPQYEHRIVAITSGAPKEGKSVTTLNLSSILAEIRHLKVLAVDGDFRRSSLAKMLGLPGKPGLADVLDGQATYEEVIQETPIPNMYLMPSGSRGERSAAELLSSTSTRHIFRQMQNDFHYTVVDTPPATTVTDVGIIGQMCHGVIVIVRMNKSHQAVAKQAVKLLQVNNIPILGCLVIGRDSPGSRYGYGYGYYYRRYYNYYNYYNKPSSD